MKIRILYLYSIIVLLMLGSCEKLDQEVRTSLTKEQVAESYDRVKTLCTSVYTVLFTGFTRLDGAMPASASDEAEHTDETSEVQKFNVGSWGPIDNPDNIWGTLYTGIRRANNFLTMTDSIRWEGLVLNPTPTNLLLYQTRKAEINRMKYEVRFLRAYYYFELVKRYGGVPVIKESLSIDANFSPIVRDPLEVCIKFITDECDSAANKLPVNYATLATDYGRATKGAALALKSRVLLYAASDLFNVPQAGYNFPQLVSLPTNVSRKARWQAAADAAQAVMNLSATAPYSLATDYRALFKTYNNNEIIFTCRASASNAFERANFSIGFDNGSSGTTPSQNLVDAYEVKVSSTVAVPFDWSNSVHAANPYSPAGTLGRDPRLGLNVILNNTLYKGRLMECWTGGKDGKGVTLATKTGYYLKKYVDETTNLLTNTSVVHSWILFRYAEVLLNYAEALNEAQGPVAEVYANVNAVRGRTGIAMPALAGLAQAQMREAIRHERQVEFAFEDHRSWDVRRWKIAENVLNIPLRGVEIAQTNPSVFSYKPINIENRIFKPKMYFYPIPQSELNIMKDWAQNPGWE